MELQEFIGKFADLFDDTEMAQFNAQTRFRDLEEWSSLLALSVVGMIDEEYDVTLSSDDMKSVQTIEELFGLVEKKK